MSRAAPTSQPQSHQHCDTAPSGGEPLFAAANAARTGRAGTVGECPTPKLSTLAGDTLSNTTVGSDDRCLGGLDGSPCPPPTATHFSSKISIIVLIDMIDFDSGYT